MPPKNECRPVGLNGAMPTRDGRNLIVPGVVNGDTISVVGSDGREQSIPVERVIISNYETPEPSVKTIVRPKARGVVFMEPKDPRIIFTDDLPPGTRAYGTRDVYEGRIR